MSKTTVFNHNSGHLCSAGCACTRNRKPGLTPDLSAAVREGVRRGLRRVEMQRVPTLTEQVQQELRLPGNERVIAEVDEASGTVAAYLAPRPYYETRNVDDQRILSDEQRTALEAERDGLIARLSELRFFERIRTEDRIREIERSLAADRTGREDARRNAERKEERKRERG